MERLQSNKKDKKTTVDLDSEEAMASLESAAPGLGNLLGRGMRWGGSAAHVSRGVGGGGGNGRRCQPAPKLTKKI